MPPEIDIQKVINSFWGRRANELGFADIEEWDDWTEGLLPSFVDPSPEDSIPLVEFVQCLDTNPFLDLLRSSYRDFGRVKEELPARLRFFAYFALSGEVYLTKAYKRLDVTDYQMLGFEDRPTYEMVREFVYERIGRRRFQLFFDTIVKELARLLEKEGVPFGERTSQDAMDLPALKHDSEAEYNDYYKEYGYKADITIDLDHNLPLDYRFTGINEDEGKNLIPTVEHLSDMDMHPKEHKVDGKYATFKNIAYAETHRTHMIYRVQDKWTEKPDIDETTIKRRYQRYHNRNDFRVGASIETMLQYLQQRGEHELVGNYYRNQTIALTAKPLQKHMDNFKERGVKMEGFNGTAKCHTALAKRPTKRGKRAMKTILDLSMLAFAFAALIRAQNKAFTHLASLGGFG